MVQQLTYLYGFNLRVARAMVDDLTPEQMVEQPHGVVNHPAWSLGHLVMVSDWLARLLGLESEVADGWAPVFATGGIPSNDVSRYPSKEELLEALEAQHARSTAAIEATDPAWFDTPNPDEKRRKRFPTLGDQAVFLMTGHEMLHLGQVAAWRRAMGLPPARR